MKYLLCWLFFCQVAGWGGFEDKLIFRYGQKIAQRFATPDSEEQFHELCALIERTHAQELALSFRERWLDLPEAREFLEVDALAQEILSWPAKRQLYFEMYKTLAYFHAIAGFRTAHFLQRQKELLLLAAKTLTLCEKHPEDFFPTFPERNHVHFVFDSCDELWLQNNPQWNVGEVIPPYPIAVYKNSLSSTREQFAWETACLFHVDEAFTPTTLIDVYNHECLANLQPYWHSFYLTWPKHRLNRKKKWEYHASLVNHFDFRPFSLCCIGSLLLSLGDQGPINTRYHQLNNGFLALLNFDNSSCFPEYNGFFPTFSQNEVTHCSRSYWAWYYDFPQADKVLTESDLDYLRAIVHHWPQRLEDFKTYLNHPLNNFWMPFQDYALEALEERLKILYRLIMEKEGPLTLKDLLYAILPPYKPLIQKIESFFPEAQGAALTLLFCPNHSLKELKGLFSRNLHLPEESCEDFFEWYRQFVISLNAPVFIQEN